MYWALILLVNRRTSMQEHFTLRIDEVDVPVRLIKERRRSIRVYMGKEEVIMRIPLGFPPAEEAKQRQRLIGWLRRQSQKREGLFARYQQADYQSGDILRVGQRQYKLSIQEATRKTSGGRLEAGNIHLTLNQDLAGPDRSKAIRHLLSRLIGADFLPAITRRVHELNDQHFRKLIKEVKLKYIHSRWGSCSSSGNINLSTRLLFAPPEVVDYVIIHELAHLVELNHGPRFWAEVERAMPDYQQHEAWLAEFGGQCDF
jgi:predicted metal-dependent hydrolase